MLEDCLLKRGKFGRFYNFISRLGGFVFLTQNLPDGSTVSFKYDALGRRIEKRLFNRKTRWVWDGNVPLHEWNEVYTKGFTEEKGEFYNMKPSKTTTWLFEERTFVPNGKLVGEESFSIQSNYLGTPEVMYNTDGKVVWSAELDAYGDVQELTGERTNCPFRYQDSMRIRRRGCTILYNSSSLSFSSINHFFSIAICY